MKHKGNRDIPDFSKKRPAGAAPPDAKGKPASPPPKVKAKPQSTASRQGQRGR